MKIILDSLCPTYLANKHPLNFQNFCLNFFPKHMGPFNLLLTLLGSKNWSQHSWKLKCRELFWALGHCSCFIHFCIGDYFTKESEILLSQLTLLKQISQQNKADDVATSNEYSYIIAQIWNKPKICQPLKLLCVCKGKGGSFSYIVSETPKVKYKLVFKINFMYA